MAFHRHPQPVIRAGGARVPQHTVKQGECINSIADTYGFFWQTLWDHGDNRELKEARQNPNVLMPGDVVHIPDKTPGEEGCATEQLHKFRLKGVPAKLRVKFLRGDEARANAQCSVDVDGKLLDLSTDADGLLEIDIPPKASKAVVTFKKGGDVHILNLGHADPAKEPSGAVTRLKNLGYDPGDDSLSPRFKAAVKRFQGAQGMEITGELDDETMEKLKEAHAS